MPRSAPLFLATLIALPGCAGSKQVRLPDYGSEDGLKIAQLVSDFNDAKADPAKFKKAFEKAPSNWREYEKHTYEVTVGSPKIDGTAATATVTVHNESNYEVITTQEWSFTKVGDAWKIQSAPIR